MTLPLFAWADARDASASTCAGCPQMDAREVGHGRVRYCRAVCVWVRPDWPHVCKTKPA